ncbi:MAG: DUF1801 domain-containing protein [Bacilli bacterium]|jgi:uncharacterized protein YdhG (YjbR/CyaY superfamily)|nr:DUF1801 domain-containing protein [Bacilli bacterium]MCH4235421.1 DUF1801 domain-containing protein [Bacilli bacterium]
MKWENVDQYINSLSDDHKNKLNNLRQRILSIDPRIKEGISYNMPSFILKRVLLSFYIFKNHIGLYPHAAAIEYFKDDLKPYRTSKGAIQIPLADSLPMEVIEKIVKYNIALLAK